MTSPASIEIIAGTPPGGGQDRAARALAEALEFVVALPVIVTNIPGRGGGNGWDALGLRRGDAGVIAISSPTMVTNRLLRIATIDHHDLVPLANLYTEYILFCVPADSAVTGPDMLANELGSSQPLVTAFATERGNINHVVLGQVTLAAGGDPSSLPIRVFTSARLAIADILAGHASVAAVSAPSATPEIEAGTVRPVAVAAPQRLADPLSGVPTWLEHGIDATIGTWRGVVGPPGLDAAAAAWRGRLENAVATEAWQLALARHGWANTYLGSEEVEAFLDDQTQVLQAALEALGLVGADGAG